MYLQLFISNSSTIALSKAYTLWNLASYMYILGKVVYAHGHIKSMELATKNVFQWTKTSLSICKTFPPRTICNMRMPNCCQWLSRSILVLYIPVTYWEHRTTVCGLTAEWACLWLAHQPHCTPALPTPYKRYLWYYRDCKKTISKTSSEYCTAELAIKH